MNEPYPPQPQAQAPMSPQQQAQAMPQPQNKPQPQAPQPKPRQPTSTNWAQNIRVPTTEAATAIPKLAEGGFMNDFGGEEAFMDDFGGAGMAPQGLMAPQADGELEDLPPGSLPHEVADDIPALISQGEFMMPADVVRWHGVKTLMAMREEAKFGLAEMQQEGMIQKPAGALEAAPDDVSTGFMGSPSLDNGDPAGAFPMDQEPLGFSGGGEAGGEANDQSGSSADSNGSGFGGADGGVGASGGAGDSNTGVSGASSGGYGYGDNTSGVAAGYGPNDATALGGYLDADDLAALDAALNDPSYGALSPLDEVTLQPHVAIPKDYNLGRISTRQAVQDPTKDWGAVMATGLMNNVGGLFGMSTHEMMDTETGKLGLGVNVDPVGALGGYAGRSMGSTAGGLIGGAFGGPLGAVAGSAIGGIAGTKGGTAAMGALGDTSFGTFAMDPNQPVADGYAAGTTTASPTGGGFMSPAQAAYASFLRSQGYA